MDNPKSPKPPKHLSDLMLLAVKDARSLPRNQYTPNAYTFHAPNIFGNKPTCQVCDAGAIIAGTLRAPLGEHFTPSNFPEWRTALEALDCARTGDYNDAINLLRYGVGMDGGGDPDGFNWQKYSAPVASNFEDWEAFDMHLDSLQDIAMKLKEDGF